MTQLSVEAKTFLIGPMDYRGREQEKYPLVLEPEDYDGLPILAGVPYDHEIRERRRIVKVLTQIPEEMGVLRSNFAKNIYEDETPERAIRRFAIDLYRLRRELPSIGYSISNPVPHTGRNRLVNMIDGSQKGAEARYGLAKTNLDAMVEEEELILGAAKGNADYFGVLFEEHLSEVRRVIYFRTGHPDTVDDLSAATFAKAWACIGRYTHEMPFKHWLLSIARNQTIDYWRRESKYKQMPEFFDQVDFDTPLPEDIVISGFQNEGLKEAVAKLPDEQQMVIFMRFVLGCPHDQVAAKLGKSVVAVRQIQTRAVIRLKGLMADWADD